MATKIVLTKGLIETREDEKDLTHGQAAHKCQRIMEAAWQKHHTAYSLSKKHILIVVPKKKIRKES